MRLTSIIMYISPVVIFILYLYVGFSEAAPRIRFYDASPISEKPSSASETSQPFYTVLPNNLPKDKFVLEPLSILGIIPSPTVSIDASTEDPISRTASNLALQPPITDPTNTSYEITSVSIEQIAAQISRISGPRKRSTDARTSVFTPKKMLQTMVSMDSQRTANDAWSADNIDASITSIENSQETWCNCSSGAEGILDPDDCDHQTGQCSCMSGYTGLQCEDCEEGHFTNGTTGCLPCGCDSFGAVNHLCDSLGICVCKTGVYGPKCDECHPGFFRFSNTGCQPCQCNNQTNYCHPQSGVCLNCLGNTYGANCDECKPKFYRSPNSACSPCPCPNTTSSGSCHTDSDGFPVCDQCFPQYSGSNCKACSDGFYRAAGACIPCNCSGNADPKGPAQVCHSESGQCLSCINNTTGRQCQLCAPGFVRDTHFHCTRSALRNIPTPANMTETEIPESRTFSPAVATTSTITSKSSSSSIVASSSPPANSSKLLIATTTQALQTSLGSPTDNTTAALTEVSWTQFNIIILAVIILVVLLLLGFVGGVYTYREYQNRKLNAPFWTIELKEDNISFSSYHDSIPNADVSGLLEDEANEVAPNGQLALTTQGNCYKA